MLDCMIKFPYGLMNFSDLIQEGYYYVDRTQFIERCENAAKTLFCVRPRRMGKTLWLDTLANYYDIKKKDQFEELFGNLYIGKNPTRLKNQLLVWKLDFSKIQVSDNNIKMIESSFDDYITDSAKKFQANYQEYLPNYEINYDNHKAISITNQLMSSVELSGYKMYVLIDEYDNFTNELISTGRNTDYSQLVNGDGLLKSFFKVLKACTIGSIDRIFVTGVTPITLADLSSSFNIATHLTLDEDFNELFGFTKKEVRASLEKVLIRTDTMDKFDEYSSIMKHYYDGYLFAKYGKEHVYNPTLTFYFLHTLDSKGRVPEPLFDKNLEMDINKLEHITKISSASQKVFELLQNNETITVSEIVSGFKLKDLLNMDEQSDKYLWSYLYYHGILTYGGMQSFNVILKVPNTVSKKFYYDRIKDSLFPQKIDSNNVQEQFFTYLNLSLIKTYLEETVLPYLSNRDYIQANEFSMKIMFLSLMMRDDLYLIDSEKEILRNYCDLLYIGRGDTRKRFGLKDILIEFKFVKLSEIEMSSSDVKVLSEDELKNLPPVKAKIKEAEEQSLVYMDKLNKKLFAHNPFFKDMSDFHINPVRMVFVGFDRVVVF
jgi:hypothetical protein